MKNLIKVSIKDPRPYYIRFGKGDEKIVTSDFTTFDFSPKVFGSLKSKIIICTTGVLLQKCLEVQALLMQSGISTLVIHFPYLNELQILNFTETFKNAKRIFCIEEHIPRGGLFTQILHEFVQLKILPNYLEQLSLPNLFSHKYGSQDEHLDQHGLTSQKIFTKILSAMTF